MFTVIVVVCSLKSMCISSFVLIGCCVSELHGHLCPYRNVLPKAVYCCFTRTTLFTETYSTVIIDIYQYAKFRLSTLSGYWDTLVETEEEEEEEEEEQQQQQQDEELWKWTFTILTTFL